LETTRWAGGIKKFSLPYHKVKLQKLMVTMVDSRGETVGQEGSEQGVRG
jgi:hypothetical protein